MYSIDKHRITSRLFRHRGFGLVAVLALSVSVALLTGCGSKAASSDMLVGDEAVPMIEDFPHTTSSEHRHIETVRLTLDAFDMNEANRVKDALNTIEDIRSIGINRELNMVEVYPEPDTFLDLYDIRSAVNSIRGTKVIRMDVIASGKLDTFLMRHNLQGMESHPHTRHRLLVGKNEDDVFILAETPKLEELVQSGQTNLLVVGTVPAFEGHVPILKVTDFAAQEAEG